MHFSTVTLLVVGFACVYAAPADPVANVPEAQQKLVNEIQTAFKPVGEQIRGLFETGEKAMENVGGEAAKAGERLMDTAKGILSSMQQTDRANMPNNLMEKAAEIRNELKEDVRSLVEKAVQSAEPMKGNIRSILFSARDALEVLESKYLTNDGKDLLRSVASLAGNFKLPIQNQH